MSDSRPWFPMHPDLFWRSARVRLMSVEAAGLYFALLCEQWREGGAISADPDVWQATYGHRCSHWETSWQAVRPCFDEAESGLMVNARLEAERGRADEIREKRRAAGQASARARSASKRSASAEQVLSTASTPVNTGTGTETKTEREHPPTPSSPAGASGGASPRSSDDEPPREGRKPRKGKPRWSGEIPADWPSSLVLAFEQFRQHREEIRKPLTPTAGDRLMAKLRKLGPERAEAALNHTTENGWTGVHEPKDERVNGHGGGPQLSPPNRALKKWLENVQLSPDAGPRPRLLD